MIQLPANISPAQDVLNSLQKYQEEIDALLTFEEKSAKTKQIFSNRNKIGNKVFDTIKLKLTQMCSGARRCVYCEDSVGDEVEHIHPKNLYPELCFNWGNYVYACGNCNGPKNNKFAVFRDSDGLFCEVNPHRGQKAMQPPSGEDAMINPRIENPLDYCILDISRTFEFVLLPNLNERKHKKADYTFNFVLRLNEREFLRKARANAYTNYKARLYYYTNKKNDGVQGQILHKMIEGIKGEAHPTVWQEMKRYHTLGILTNIDSELNELFIASPEALAW